MITLKKTTNWTRSYKKKIGISYCAKKNTILKIRYHLCHPINFSIINLLFHDWRIVITRKVHWKCFFPVLDTSLFQLYVVANPVALFSTYYVCDRWFFFNHLLFVPPLSVYYFTTISFQTCKNTRGKHKICF